MNINLSHGAYCNNFNVLTEEIRIAGKPSLYHSWPHSLQGHDNSDKYCMKADAEWNILNTNFSTVNIKSVSCIITHNRIWGCDINPIPKRCYPWVYLYCLPMYRNPSIQGKATGKGTSNVLPVVAYAISQTLLSLHCLVIFLTHWWSSPDTNSLAPTTRHCHPYLHWTLNPTHPQLWHSNTLYTYFHSQNHSHASILLLSLLKYIIYFIPVKSKTWQLL